MPDIIERLKRGHQGSGIGPLDCHDALQEIERLRSAIELAEQVFSKLERGGMPSISYGETIGVLRRALRS